jgi:HPt (histidine-containing phosphotransfer) domain-containing protein
MTASTLSEQRKFILAESGMMNCTVVQEPAAKVCNLDYLLQVTRGNQKIINNIVTVFFKETKKEMIDLTGAIEKRNYPVISDIAHKIKSAFSILGITVLEAVFKEMEQLSSNTSPIANIEQLNHRVHFVFNQAKVEMNY